MNCPKCGFEQEEREDCGRCGVVIAKYLALHAPSSAAYSETQAFSSPSGGPPDESRNAMQPDITAMQSTLHNLQRRCNELELEPSERLKLLGEFRSLEEKTQEGLSQIAALQEKIRLRAGAFEASPEIKDLGKLAKILRSIDLESVVHRLAVVEARIHSSSQDERTAVDPKVIALLQKLDVRLSEIEKRDSTAEKKLATARNREHAKMESVRKELTELKTSLQNVSIRYTEIGDLKKNNLILRNMLETLQAENERFRKESTIGDSERVAELEKEVRALRAEVRKAYERMELLESRNASAAGAPGASLAPEIVTLGEELARIGSLQERNRERADSELRNLEARFDASLPVLDSLPEKLASLATQIQRLEQQYQPPTGTLDTKCNAANATSQGIENLSWEKSELCEDLLETQSPLQDCPIHQEGELSPPASTEMGAIRNSLEEIRQFMAVLSQKL